MCMLRAHVDGRTADGVGSATLHACISGTSADEAARGCSEGFKDVSLAPVQRAVRQLAVVGSQLSTGDLPAVQTTLRYFKRAALTPRHL